MVLKFGSIAKIRISFVTRKIKNNIFEKKRDPAVKFLTNVLSKLKKMNFLVHRALISVCRFINFFGFSLRWYSPCQSLGYLFHFKVIRKIVGNLLCCFAFILFH